MSNLDRLEAIAAELIAEFDVDYIPVPLETILQNPKDNMWDKVDITQLSGSFLSLKDPYSPRMSIARLLARHTASSPWGRDRDLFTLLREGNNLKNFARMLIMPKPLVEKIPKAERNPTPLSQQFEAPADDVRLRLDEVFGSGS